MRCVTSTSTTVYQQGALSGISHPTIQQLFSNLFFRTPLITRTQTFLTTDNFKDAVLKAVNLGDDSDTVGCVTGGMAGLFYGFEQIPSEWVEVLAKRENIEELCKAFLAEGF